MKFSIPSDGGATETLAARGLRDVLARFVGDGVLLIDPNGRLRFASLEARLALGAASDEELETSWSRISRTVIDAAADVGAPHDDGVDVDWVAGGNTRRLFFRVHRLGGDKCDGFVAIVRNRDRLDALEVELALASHLRTLDHVTHAVVHDLRTPLNTMVFNVELLRQSIEKKGSDVEARENQFRYLEGLRGEISRLNALLNAFAGQVTLPDAGAGDFDLRQVVQEIGAVLEAQAKRRRIAFGIRNVEHHVRVPGAKGRAQYAILAIALAALDSTPPAEAFELELEDRDRRARLYVRHGGPALSFELPDRGNVRSSAQDRGAWAGLSIARAFVETLDGQVDVETEPSRGARIHLTFPLLTKKD
jgi:signal transduction histidine kinase